MLKCLWGGLFLLCLWPAHPGWAAPLPPKKDAAQRAGPKAVKERPPVLLPAFKPLTLAIGAPHTLTWSGGGKTVPKLIDFDPETAEVTLSPGHCRVTGKKKCDVKLVLDWGPGGPRWSLPISFRPPAGWVPDPLRLKLTGVQDVEEALRHQLLAYQIPQAKCDLSLESDEKNPDELRAKIQFSAPGYLTIGKTVHLNLERAALTPTPAELLFLSNRPEKLVAAGVLLDEPWQGHGPCRLLFHHKYTPTETPAADLNLELRCRNLGPETSLHLALSTLGPAKDEIYVGHLATQRFLQKVSGASLASWVVNLPADREICLDRVRLKPGQTVSGMALLVPNGPLRGQLRVVACHSDGSGAEQIAPDQGATGRTARGVFPAQIEQQYQYQAGDRYLFIQLGGPPYLEDSRTHEKSPGNFGAVYRYTLQLTNPTAEDYDFSVSASARGGPARGHFFVDGALVDPGNLGANPSLLRRWHLNPGEERQVILETLPQSGSNYPLSLVVGALKSRSAAPDLGEEKPIAAPPSAPLPPGWGTIPRMIP